MLKTLDLRDQNLDSATLREALPRAALDVAGALQQVAPVIADVKSRGAEALRDYCQKFDGVRPQNLRVSAETIQKSLEELDPRVRVGLEIAIENVRRGHETQLPTEKTTQIIPGGIVKQRWVPVNRVGLYVPGGLAVYPSSVVMNVVAAQVAGVSDIALASPPQKAFGGSVHPTILAACALLGVSEVYSVGGAQAIAMLAYGAKEADGTPVCAPVDVVTGPGNIFVAAAKRAVAGICGIDAEAGTTEIAIVADKTANPAFVAADLISQAEHDAAAASVLITDSVELAQSVEEEVQKQAATTKHAERVQTALSGPQSGIVLVKDLDQAVEVANAYAAEHLEIQTANPTEVSARINSAGAIFLGSYTPVPLGDYLAGSNHVLPTAGTARFQSGLSVMAYIKPVQEVHYSEAALAQLAAPLRSLAVSEDLPAHADCVDIRLPGNAAD